MMKRFLLFFFLCITLLLFTGGLFLKNGVQITAFTAGPATLSNLSLKWQSKLELQIESLDISF